MVVKFLGNTSVTIEREGDVGTWEINKKNNFAIINKINNRLRIFRDSMFSVIATLGS